MGIEEELLQQYHRALEELINGSPDVYKAMLSERDDVTLANPFGPVARGRAAVEDRLERAASNYTDGELVGFDQIAKYETPDLAYLVEVERFTARVGGPGMHRSAHEGHEAPRRAPRGHRRGIGSRGGGPGGRRESLPAGSG